MKTYCWPSRYRYCISRLSMIACSSFSSARYVRSSTAPVRTFFSFVRTNAPPLPGFTCWKSTTPQSWPSRLSVMPFFRSFVVAKSVASPAWGPMVPGPEGRRASWLKDEQLPGYRGEQLAGDRASAGAHHEGVLDPDTTPARQVDAGLDGDGNSGRQSTRPGIPDHRRLVDLQANAVAGAVTEMPAVPGRADQVPGRRVDVGHVGADGDRRQAGLL